MFENFWSLKGHGRGWWQWWSLRKWNSQIRVPFWWLGGSILLSVFDAVHWSTATLSTRCHRWWRLWFWAISVTQTPPMSAPDSPQRLFEDSPCPNFIFSNPCAQTYRLIQSKNFHDSESRATKSSNRPKALHIDSRGFQIRDFARVDSYIALFPCQISSYQSDTRCISPSYACNKAAETAESHNICPPPSFSTSV